MRRIRAIALPSAAPGEKEATLCLLQIREAGGGVSLQMPKVKESHQGGDAEKRLEDTIRRGMASIKGKERTEK